MVPWRYALTQGGHQHPWVQPLLPLLFPFHQQSTPKNNPHFGIPVFLPTDVEQPDGYYARVSEEIGLIVQGSEGQGSRARARGEPPQPAGADGVGECCLCKGFIAVTSGKYVPGACPRAQVPNPPWILTQGLRDSNRHVKGDSQHHRLFGRERTPKAGGGFCWLRMTSHLATG